MIKRKQEFDTLLQEKVIQQLVSFVFLIALLFVFTPTTAHAATFLVDSIIDAGDAIPGDGICASNVPFPQKCTVRAAIMEANASVGPDTIIVPVGTYVLRLAGQNEDNSATGDLDVLDELTIIGAGGDPNGDPSLTNIQAGDGPGQGVERVIAINPKMEKAFNTTLRSLTIRFGTHSAANSWDKGGGGVYWEASDNGGNAGSLTISNCVISDNSTSDGDGGGIALFNSSGSAIAMATIDKTVVKNNQANGVGGGIFIGLNTPINLLNSDVSTNRSNDTSLFRGYGGGIYIANNTLAANANIKNSTISNNRAENNSGKGGGIYTLGPLRLENSAIYGNASTGDSGAIYANVADGKELIIENVTISGNTADQYGGGLVFAPSDSLKYRLTNVTVTENRGNLYGGGIFLSNSVNSLVLSNSIVAKNTKENGIADDISTGTVESSSSNNLIGTGGSGGLTQGVYGNLINVVDPKLGPLANNGGETKTHGLLPGSPAIDAGNNATATILATDQRGAGFLRKIDSGDAGSIATVDIGAYEAASSSNANLTGVTISSGTVTQTDPLTYTANVSYAVGSITVTPTVDITASVTIQSQSVGSGTPSMSIPLTEGGTTPISIVVTAEDGTSKNYTLHVTRAAISTNADLSNLVISAGMLDTPFSSGDTDYAVNVVYEVEKVTVTPTVADSTATITVNGNPVVTGSPSGDISLTAGANTPITVVVTAQSGATKTYTINVNRAAASTNADLSNLVLSVGTWDTPFSSGDTEYAVNVVYEVEKVTVTPTVADSTATITVNGNPVVTGSPSGDISLTTGANTPITVVVTAQSGATKTYTINVNRAAASTNVDLSNLVISAGMLDTPFSSGDTEYAVNVGYEVEKVTVTPTVADSTATITVNGNPVGTGTASGDISLTAGANTVITLVVTAQSGATKTYTINVNRAAASTNANLSNLVLSAGIWDTLFSSGDTDYAVNVGYEVEKVTVTPTVADSTATITVNGNPVVTGSPSGDISLTAGANTPITVVVTAQSGVTKTYTINVNRAAASTNANLSNLVLSAGTWDTPFSSGDTDYAVNVGYEVEKVTVTPTVADSTATITVNGNPVGTGTASGDISLTAGVNTAITVVVTAQNGDTKTYTLNVTRAAVSTNADLSNLLFSDGVLSPTFSPSTTSYTASVPNSTASITLRPTSSESHASVKVNNQSVTSGTHSGAIHLTVGDNPIAVAVTAQDTITTKTYTVTVKRAAPNFPPPIPTIPVIGVSLHTSSLVLKEKSEPAVLLATIAPTNATNQQVRWSSSNPSVAGVDQNGRVTPFQAGEAIITVTTVDRNKTAQCNVVVQTNQVKVENVKLNKSKLTLAVGEQAEQLIATVLPQTATNKEVTWSSSNPEVASVDESGTVTPLTSGETIITVTTVDGKKMDTCRVVVIPALVNVETSQNSFLLKPTKSQRFKVYAVNSDGKRLNVTSSKKTTYEVKPSDLASVAAGNITAGKNEGEAVLTISYEGQTVELPILVTNESVKKVSLSESSFVLEPNEAKEIEATAIFGDGTERVVTKEATWTSNNPEIAQVTNGEIVAHSTGTAKVTVTYGGKKTELIVKVEEAKKVKRLTVDARSFTLSKDKSKQVTITATYEDGTKKDVTGLVEWNVSNPKVASVEEGLIMGQTKGKTTITAMYQNKKVVISVKVK